MEVTEIILTKIFRLVSCRITVLGFLRNQKSRDFCQIFVIYKKIHTLGYGLKIVLKIYRLVYGLLFFVIWFLFQGEYSRVYQAAKLYLYSPASGLYSCPLAMTDGAAKTIQSLSLSLPEAWQHLTSRNPTEFWTAGMLSSSCLDNLDPHRIALV